jgi:NO-binding membrane sensor protein with MHYT domain
MISRLRAVLEIALAVAALAGAGVTWLHARHIVGVAPVVDGQPSTSSLVYDPQQLLLTMLLATLAGVLLVVGVARLRRSRPVRPTS